MGLLSEGAPLDWEETKKWADHVRQHGVQQFIHIYHKFKDGQWDCLKWGDEIEYMLIKFDNKRKKACVSLRAQEVLDALTKKQNDHPEEVKALWRPEFGAYMIESSPAKPYGGLTSHFNIVEANMRARREEVMEVLEENETLMCLTSFPRLGCKDFTDPPLTTNPKEGYLCSLFFPDDAVYGSHPRFKTLALNIRKRRGKKVAINIPVYKDDNTPSPFTEDFSILGDTGEAAEAALPDHVYADAMGFGMGCCSLQVTFQACNITEARLLYDQLTPLCPIVMALSAASPIHRGYLTDRDCRWSVIAASVDDRTAEEQGLAPLKPNQFRIHKSRFDSIDSYLSSCGEKYNDVKLVYDDAIYKELRKAGVDHLLAQHIAHLFIRDPITLYAEKLYQNDKEDTDHFENLQSTNWQTMRFKPPPPNSNIGWRVEFRPTEIQMTEFENAAFVVFVVLLTRVILSFQLNFLIPISKVDENLSEAQERNAVLNKKYWFKKDIMTCSSPPVVAQCLESCSSPEKCEYTQMTINEIINGKDNEFPGLIPLIKKFLTYVDIDVDTQCSIQQYLNFIQRRASGELMTTAKWIREFVKNHPDYKHDSVVTEQINFDLLTVAAKIQQGQQQCPQLVGQPNTRTNEDIPIAVSKAEQYQTNDLDSQ